LRNTVRANTLVTDFAWCALFALAVGIVALLARWEATARLHVERERSCPIPSPAFSFREAGLVIAIVLCGIALSASLGHYLQPLLRCTAGCGEAR
jgi:hypothetical protein